MKNRIFFALFLTLFLSIFVYAEEPPEQQWVARYNGLGNGCDRTAAMAVDKKGDVYVTGESDGNATERDYATIKYDPNGNQLWVARYNGSANSYDDSHDIAVDNSGNVYVTGVSWNIGAGNDYATVKYDPNGNELWVARYIGGLNMSNYANAIALDNAGNVYVTGSSHTRTESDSVTIKYDSDGNQRWIATYHESGRTNGTFDIKIDVDGNVYVTGASGLAIIGACHNNYLTIKYDKDGNQLWAVKYNPTTARCGSANALAVDGSGSVYVTGRLDIDGLPGPRDDSDYATIKYDTNGNQLWEAIYNGPGNGGDTPYAIAVDKSGSVLVSGYSDGNGTKADYATIKYGPDSNIPLWVARYNSLQNGSDIARSLALDGSDNVYVTGRSEGDGTSYDYATIKYDPDGDELWAVRYNGPQNSGDDAWAIAVDDLDNVYVTGGSYGIETGSDYATIKYRQRHSCRAEINFAPDTLNLASKGKWITCHIRLPEEYNVADIDPDTVLLEEEIAADDVKFEAKGALAKFSRTDVQGILIPGETELKVTGRLNNGIRFEGIGAVRVINKSNHK